MEVESLGIWSRGDVAVRVTWHGGTKVSQQCKMWRSEFAQRVVEQKLLRGSRASDHFLYSYDNPSSKESV